MPPLTAVHWRPSSYISVHSFYKAVRVAKLEQRSVDVMLNWNIKPGYVKIKAFITNIAVQVNAPHMARPSLEDL